MRLYAVMKKELTLYAVPFIRMWCTKKGVFLLDTSHIDSQKESNQKINFNNRLSRKSLSLLRWRGAASEHRGKNRKCRAWHHFREEAYKHWCCLCYKNSPFSSLKAGLSYLLSSNYLFHFNLGPSVDYAFVPFLCSPLPSPTLLFKSLLLDSRTCNYKLNRIHKA